MAHIVLTGGCGFFGTWIIRRLLNDKHRVTVLDLERVTKRWEMVLTPAEIEGIAFRAARIEDADQTKALLAELKPDAVIHLAALQVPTCRANPLLGARINVLGTLAVFEGANALPHKPPVVYASSAAVFGSDADYGGDSVGDSSVPKPGTHYGAFKLCNENCARVYFLDHKLLSVGFRPLTVYGPGRDVGMTSFPTRAIAAAVLGQKFDIPFSGPSAYTSSEEIGALFVAAALRPLPGAPVFTVGGDIIDTPTFIREVDKVLPGAAKLITCSGGTLPITEKLQDAELRKAYPEVTRVTLQDGIRRTVEIFKALAAKGQLEV